MYMQGRRGRENWWIGWIMSSCCCSAGGRCRLLFRLLNLLHGVNCCIRRPTGLQHATCIDIQMDVPADSSLLHA